jgi:hypothetical protein
LRSRYQPPVSCECELLHSGTGKSQTRRLDKTRELPRRAASAIPDEDPRELYPDGMARIEPFLAADDSCAMTSQTYVCDGGRV